MSAGLADRWRPFALLRLTGARLGMLRRVVTLREQLAAKPAASAGR